MKTLYLYLIGITLFLTSCQTTLEPTVERIEDVDVVEMNTDRVELNAYMVLRNPNSFSLDLAKADMKAYVDDVEMATISQAYDTPMPADDIFRMPINIKIDLKKLYKDNPIGAVGKGLQIMSDKKLEVQFKGSIKVGKGSAKISVPIDQLEMVEF